MLTVKELVGDRLCLGGNVDCRTLLLENPESVFDETSRLLAACKPGGGLILGASNAVQSVVPLENYLALIEAWERHGRY